MPVFLKDYLKLIKAGITVFALISAMAGFVLAYAVHPIPAVDFFFSFSWLLLGFYFVCAGGFILNQVYEYKLDSLMNRTKKRPLPAGRITVRQALALGVFHLVVGLFILLSISPLTFFLALLTLLLYNFFYTVFWKKKYIFAAIPGALPGALPVVIGFSAVSADIFSLECLYLFFMLFLWQMPHFWALAVGYKEDYQKAGLPILPAKLGLQKTFQHISFYLLSYLGLALVSPLFFKMNIIYMLFLIPFCIKIFIEFLKFSRSVKWKPFFMWLNFSVLVFLWAPVLDTWLYRQLIS